MPTITANGIKINYNVKGKGPALTMIMGMSCSLRQWEWMSDILSNTFQVITFDNRGAGSSDKPEIDYSTEMLAKDTFCLLEELKIKKSHIFGISFGGMIAQRFALMFPDMTDRLVLGATMPNFTLFSPSETTVESFQLSALVPIPESVKIVMELFYTKDFFQEKPDLVAKIKEIMSAEKEEQSIDIMYRQIGAGMEHDTSGVVSNITSPTLIICGEKDLIAPIENSRFLAAEIPNSTLTELSGGYHAFWIERADEASKIITDFLKQ
jgi:pimeloyl-ACP methyl ester carboxylesterase